MRTFSELLAKLEIYGRVVISMNDIREFSDFARRNGVSCRTRTINGDGSHEVVLD